MSFSSLKTDFLLVRLHSLGDLVLCAPAAAAMAARGSTAFLTRTAYLPVVERFEGTVVPLGCDGGAPSLRRTAANLGNERVADLQNNIATRLAFPGAPRFRVDRRLRRRIVAMGSSAGEMEYRADSFLRVTGFTGDSEPRLSRRKWPPPDQFSVGLVTGGRWPLKALPEGVLAELARLYCDIDRARVFLLGDAGDRGAGERVRAACGERAVTNVCGEGDVGSLIERLEGLDLVVSPDSGPGHLAMALGVRTHVVFTSTSPALGFWRLSPGLAEQVAGLPCRPCHRHGGRKCPLGVSFCRTRLVPRSIYMNSRGDRV